MRSMLPDRLSTAAATLFVVSTLASCTSPTLATPSLAAAPTCQNLKALNEAQPPAASYPTERAAVDAATAETQVPYMFLKGRSFEGPPQQAVYGYPAKGQMVASAVVQHNVGEKGWTVISIIGCEPFVSASSGSGQGA